MTASAEPHLQKRGPSSTGDCSLETSTALGGSLFPSGAVAPIHLLPLPGLGTASRNWLLPLWGRAVLLQRRKQGPEYASLCDLHYKQTDPSEVELSPLYILGK